MDIWKIKKSLNVLFLLNIKGLSHLSLSRDCFIRIFSQPANE